jgi:predicted nucleic-acid-binding Zn-ribbon protein
MKDAGFVIGRPINGISINGLEYARDDRDEYLHFPTIDAAKAFLRSKGFEERDIEDGIVFQRHAACPKCNEDNFIDPAGVDDENGLAGRSDCMKCGSHFYAAAMTPEQLKKVFEEHLNFAVHLHEQEGVMGAEVEDWTTGGVDMIAWLHPFTAEEFKEYVENFDVDEQIDLHRQAEDYRNAFTCRQSVNDFDHWEKRLKNSIQTLETLGLV